MTTSYGSLGKKDRWEMDDFVIGSTAAVPESGPGLALAAAIFQRGTRIWQRNGGKGIRNYSIAPIPLPTTSDVVNRKS